MHYRIISRIIALGTILAAGTTPAEAQGAGQTPATAAAPESYQLVELAGKPLPALIDKERSCREEVTAGRLTLGKDGNWLLEGTTREVCGERVAETETDTGDGRYAVEGQTVRFYDDDGRDDRDRDNESEIDLDDLDTGTLASDGTLAVRLDDGRTTLEFRK